MLDELTFRGLFWLPDEPKRKLAGTLNVSQERIDLDLLGSFDDGGRAPGLEPRDRILGHSADGRALTLERCHPSNWQFNTAGLSTSTYAPSYVLVGAWFEEDEEIAFDELLLRYSDLDEWVTVSGFDIDLTSEQESVSGIDVAFRPPDPLKISLPEDELVISFSWQLGEIGPVTTDVRVTQRARLTVRFENQAPLKRVLEYTYQLRNFLGLAVGRPVHPLSVRGLILPPPGAEPDAETGIAPQPIGVDIYYRLSSRPEGGRKRHPHEMLFTLEEARPRFETLLRNWFNKQEILRPVFDLYFGATYNPHSFLEQTFLSLMQALETYHRRTSSETELPEEQHQDRLDAILASVPVQHRDWLSKKLLYSNELTLRRRLKDVLGRCPLVVDNLVDDRSRFVIGLLDTRNYLTHYDKSLESKAAKGLALYPFVVRVRSLVEMCLLLELGFSCKEVAAIFDRVDRYAEAENADN